MRLRGVARGRRSPLTTPQPYTAGYTGDVFAAVAELRRQLPHAPLLAVGVSLGASILTKYLAEAADTEAGAGLVAAASVSNPMDLTVLPTGVQRDPKLLWPYLVVLSVRLYHYMVVHWSMLKTHPKLQVRGEGCCEQ
jgi:predicted alpha/beta-fold hydrolase